LEVIADINTCITDALRSLPGIDGDTALRLTYLRAERAYYEALAAHDARLHALLRQWRAPGCEARPSGVAPPPAPLNDVAPQPKDGPVLQGVIDKPTGVRTETGHSNTHAGEGGDEGQPSEGQQTPGQRSEPPP
jgi:hypothetical protein